MLLGLDGVFVLIGVAGVLVVGLIDGLLAFIRYGLRVGSPFVCQVISSGVFVSMQVPLRARRPRSLRRAVVLVIKQAGHTPRLAKQVLPYGLPKEPVSVRVVDFVGATPRGVGRVARSVSVLGLTVRNRARVVVVCPVILCVRRAPMGASLGVLGVVTRQVGFLPMIASGQQVVLIFAPVEVFRSSKTLARSLRRRFGDNLARPRSLRR